MEYPGKVFLTSEQQAFMDDCFKKFNKKDDIIFQSGNIEINRGDIDDILTNQYLADNHIKQIHEDKAGAFPNDITTWKLQTLRGVPIQSNDYDCGIFVCKYMERVVLRQKTGWASLKDWQKYMPKFRAELGYALCLTTKM
ncbi:hypothetical protein IEQ34_022860 [Dendrobium chrysotoxum]|uniref:Ubiquitin-like protease family profile domain-containing protein n=1 Tax=Dendrobium chrysotoxum TaxID=161865 RepID=A0AAV7G080_DENCH|nr:hypothetical protein IEQ34_022860 [Dendrobium chrysotoxum]